jgi:signal transduction histidine kinase
MSEEVGDSLTALSQFDGHVESALRQAGDAPGRALLLARLLQQLCPSAPLAACLLQGRDGLALTVLDGTGAEQPDWARPLQGELLTVMGDAPLSGAAHAELPAAVGLAGHPLVAVRASAAGRGRGVLALALPAGGSAAVRPLAALLGVAATRLALRLHVEEQQAELAAEGRAATLGELAHPLTHEFNNFLNVLGLQLAVLEMELPEALRADLKQIRRHSTAVTSLIRQFQRYPRPPDEPTLSDPNEIIQQALAALCEPRGSLERQVVLVPDAPAAPGAVAVEFSPAPGLPRVHGPAPELRRLCYLLLKNAAAVADLAAGAVLVRTEAAGDQVVVRFEDNGRPIPEEHLPEPFDPHVPAREGSSALELAACRSMARRLGGSLTAENRPGDGVAVLLDLPAGPPVVPP